MFALCGALPICIAIVAVLGFCLALSFVGGFKVCRKNQKKKNTHKKKEKQKNNRQQGKTKHGPRELQKAPSYKFPFKIMEDSGCWKFKKKVLLIKQPLSPL